MRRRDLRPYECWRVPSYLMRFQAAGRPFQVHVALGALVTAARRAEVVAALDSLRVGALAPPPADPYAGWHSLVDESGDTLRAHQVAASFAYSFGCFVAERRHRGRADYGCVPGRW